MRLALPGMAAAVAATGLTIPGEPTPPFQPPQVTIAGQDADERADRVGSLMKTPIAAGLLRQTSSPLHLPELLPSGPTSPGLQVVVRPQPPGEGGPTRIISTDDGPYIIRQFRCDRHGVKDERLLRAQVVIVPVPTWAEPDPVR